MDARLNAYRLLIADVYELAGASRRTSETIAAAVGQTAARWNVMSVVSEEDHNVPAIARRLGLARQSVQRVVEDLAAAGTVALVANPDHARSPLVRLTEAGRHQLADLFRRSDSDRVAVLDRSGLREEELLEAREVVRALAAALEEQGDRP